MKVKVGKTDLLIERGDLTELEVDAIVNAANSHLWMGAGVASAIKRKGGVIIEEEAVRQGPVEVGEAVITTAGNLPATHVIHAAAMGQDLKTDANKIAQATRSSLAIANKHKLSSIAFPALGTGVGGFPPAQAAEAMLGAVLSHIEGGNTSLRKIVFVLYQEEAWKAFTDTLNRLRGGK
ncbi:MAG: macro domain-containing protein [Candidatus Rokubacteria bacterium]|nr:macro domain-containing protein [Candidatus Rokubacteria bacterium]